ncbi:MAG: DUF4493 domain-containing protein [Parabacteroides sp.]|nr:DUF4493 domain-containing protein [Parabacteroides sp.]
MKKYPLYTLLAGLLVLLAACEMKDDLTGKTKVPGSNQEVDPNQLGVINLKLDPQKEKSVVGNTTKATDEELDVNDFAVQVLDEDGKVVNEYDSFADIEELRLPAGNYQIVASKGELKNAAFDAPYYKGEEKCVVNPLEVADVVTPCVLDNKKVSLFFSEEFADYFLDDYDIVMTNGIGVLTAHAGENRTPYFKTTDQLDFTLRATTKNGEDVNYYCDLYNDPKVKDYNNVVVALDIVKPSEPEVPDIPGGGTGEAERPLIKIDVSLVEREYVIEIPSNIVSGGDEEGGDTLTKPSIEGDGFDLDKPVILTSANAKDTKVVINIELPTGVSAMKVNINSTDAGFMSAVADIGNPFDMLHLNDMQSGLLDAVKAGQKTIRFDVSSFMELLINFPGTHTFTIAVDDRNGTKNSKTLTIKAINEE